MHLWRSLSSNFRWLAFILLTWHVSCVCSFLPVPSGYSAATSTAAAGGLRFLGRTLMPLRNNADSIDGPVSFELIGITPDDTLECPMPGRELITDRNNIMFSGPSSHQVTLKWNQKPKRYQLRKFLN